MKRSFDGYERLARGVFGCSSLWMGADHLLYVRGKGVLFPIKERYSRYRYRDIQSISVAPTPWFALGLPLYGGGLLLMAAFFALPFFVSPIDAFNTGVWVGMMSLALVPSALMCGFMLIWHFVRGRRCIFEIQTGLQREQLMPLSSLKQAQAAVARLSVLIETAQAEDASSVGAEDFDRVEKNETVEMPIGITVTFVVLGIYSVLLARLAIDGGRVAVVLTIIFAVIATIVLCVGMASCLQSRTPDSVKPFLWAALVLMVVSLYTGFVYYIFMTVNDVTYSSDQMGFIYALEDLSSNTTAGVGFSFMALGAALLTVSIFGFVISSKWRAALKRNTPAS